MEDGKKLIQLMSQKEAFYFKNNVGASDDDKAKWLINELNVAARSLEELNLETHLYKYLLGCASNIGNKLQ